MATPMPPATVQRHHRPPRVSVFHHLSSSSLPIFISLTSFRSRIPLGADFYLRARSSVDCNLLRSLPLSASNPRKWSGRCRATSPGGPSPPKLDPPPGNDPDSSSGIMSRFSKVKDAVRIFFAVLFWMSLFFWSCVWDGRNGGGPNKGSRFRR